MNSRSLSRRTALQAAGVTLGLPLLDAMATTTDSIRAKKPVSRAAFIYVPNGVNITKWIPETVGKDYQLSPSLKALGQHKQEFSILSGMCHPQAKGGHSGADTWLTAADLGGTPGYDYRNTISIDQQMAKAVSLETRIPSLELSANGGTGSPGHSQTLSFSDRGVPLPSEKNPRVVFERLFSKDSPIDRRQRQQRIDENKSVLDAVLAQAERLHEKLGHRDRQKLDEYLTSVRDVESRVQRAEQWMKVPKAHVDAKQFPLSLTPKYSEGSHHYYRLMFDLITLAFKTDTTRICTFQLAREAHPGFLQGLPIDGNHHELSHHGGDKQMLNGLFVVDQYYLKQLSYFLNRLQQTEDGESNLLARTCLVYGSGMNSGLGGGHSSKNLPLLVAGGSALGMQHGQHLRLEDIPISNLYSTIQTQMGLKPSFGDSTGMINELCG